LNKFSINEKITIGVAAYGNVETSKICLNKIFESIKDNFELILVDDCSPDKNKTKDFFLSVKNRHANTKVFSFDKNKEYTESVNCILCHATGKKILFVSNDVNITPYYLRTIMDISKKIPNFGTIRGVSNFVDNGSKLHNIDIKNEIKNIDQINEFSKKIYEDKRLSFFEEKFLTGDVFLVNRKSLEDIGYFDNFFFGYFSDHDFGIRLRKAGYKLLVAKGAFAYHQRDSNFKYLDEIGRKNKLNTRWARVFENWARFKIKYSLPVDLMYASINYVPWDKLSEKSKEKKFIKKIDYSKFLL
jgi:GT2 family glycosyltransferase